MKKVIQKWILVVSLLVNGYQWSFMVGYDKNVKAVVDAYEVEQLQNFDLNRMLHEYSMIIWDLQWELKQLKEVVPNHEEVLS
mgnify:CR=1 FL=1|tara:strand:- start:19 stop:264 length:246 start_codon:yes stop_codon:yes gene_type:complete